MLTIRSYTKKDSKAVFEINKACHDAPEPNVPLLMKLEVYDTWVAELDGRVVGFLIAEPKGNEFLIYNIAVLRDYRKQGIATELIKTFERAFQEKGYASLHVSVNNPALKLYFDLGYRVTEFKSNFYGQGRNALFMCKSLGI